MTVNDTLVYHGQQSSTQVTVRYCLVGEQAKSMDTRCGFHYNSDLLIVVCICTVMETMLIGLVAMRFNAPTSVLLGDAIVQMLSEHDETTDIQSSDISEPLAFHNDSAVKLEAVKWLPLRPTWFSAVSKKVWVISMTL